MAYLSKLAKYTQQCVLGINRKKYNFNIGKTKTKPMKKLLFILFLGTLSFAKAQFTDLKGLTFDAKKIIYSDSGTVKSVEAFQIFNFSFKDMMLMHNIIKSNNIESQLYKLQNISKVYSESTKKTTFWVEAVSGLSGLVYKYEININNDGVAELLLNGYLYSGDSYKIKTYTQ
ncbi:MAG: hypothetical protein K0S32_314 [Bacteroidetes bacterium]|jgi:hypothetical protein|nr:hypothetical protein [Bacteroidota bacterium]